MKHFRQNFWRKKTEIFRHEKEFWTKKVFFGEKKNVRQEKDKNENIEQNEKY